MTTIIEPYKIAIGITVILGVTGLIANVSPIVSASLAAATNQTGNQTGGGNTTTTAGGGGGDQATAKMHLDEAMKALQAGDTAGAQTHAQLAQGIL